MPVAGAVIIDVILELTITQPTLEVSSWCAFKKRTKLNKLHMV